MKTSLDDDERRRLRARCTAIVPGFVARTPAEEYDAMAAWSAAQGVDADRYGDGAHVAAFEAKVAALLGKEAAVVFPSGIMAQLAAVRIWCERAGLERFGLHPTSHLASHEEESYAALLRLHAVPIGDRLRPMVAADVAAVAQRLATIVVELPIREAGGKLPSWSELDALKAAAASRGTPLHMDGARLWECAAYYEKSHAEIADGFASVYVSLYKGIGAFAGAVLAGDADFVGEARLWRRRLGGTLSQMTPFVASAALRLDERLALMPALYRRTLTLAGALSGVDGLRVDPPIPHVNMLHLYVDATAEDATIARDRVAAETGTWLCAGLRPAAVPGWSVVEIYVGDACLALDDDALVPLFSRLAAR